MLIVTGEGYGYTYEKYEIQIDTSQTFSVQHEDDMTTVYYQDGWLTLKRETFEIKSV